MTQECKLNVSLTLLIVKNCNKHGYQQDFYRFIQVKSFNRKNLCPK